MSPPRHPGLLTALWTGAILSACAPMVASPTAAPREEGQLIEREAIHSSGAPNAWEVVRRYGAHLHLSDDRAGRPSRVNRRGRESILLREDPLLIVDGTVSEFRLLFNIPSRDLQRIRILTGTQGTTRYGMSAASGAIIVETRRSDSQ